MVSMILSLKPKQRLLRMKIREWTPVIMLLSALLLAFLGWWFKEDIDQLGHQVAKILLGV